jgi:hypothetical protein
VAVGPSDRGPWRTVLGLVHAGMHSDVLILRGFVSRKHGYADLIAAAILNIGVGRWRLGKAALVIADATWEQGSRRLDRMFGAEVELDVDASPTRFRGATGRLLRHLDSSRTHFCVLSTYEQATFKGTWGMKDCTVHFTPFFASEVGVEPRSRSLDVFAGGNSMRDYRALLAAIPEIRGSVRVATNLPTSNKGAHSMIGPLSEADYERVSATAKIVIVPLRLRSSRSAGQNTYLTAMARGQVVVVTDSPGARDHIDHGVNGLIVTPEDPASLASQINSLLDEPERCAEIGKRARVYAETCATERGYYQMLLDIARSTVQEEKHD